MRIPPNIARELNIIKTIDVALFNAFISLIYNSTKISIQDILQYSCRYQNRTMDGLGEMLCKEPSIRLVSAYVIGICTGQIKPGVTRS
jgi:hypothetical protein